MGFFLFCWFTVGEGWWCVINVQLKCRKHNEKVSSCGKKKVGVEVGNCEGWETLSCV